MPLSAPDPYFARLQAMVDGPEANAPAADPELRARFERHGSASGAYRGPEVNVDTIKIAGPHGPVTARVYQPVSPDPDWPLFVWCHGGGWWAGDLDMPEADATSREVCARAGAVVISVDYRLAVDGVHFPVPHDDVLAVARWSAEQVPGLRANSRRFVLGGASAGANLAAGVALRLRDEGGRLPALLVLAYPALHPELPEPSPDLAEVLPRLSPSTAMAPAVYQPMVENYLGGPALEASGYAMPGLADPSGLPPTFILECELDGLRASSQAYARQLADAGVPTETRRIPGVAHGVLNRPGLPGARRAHALLAQRIRAF